MKQPIPQQGLIPLSILTHRLVKVQGLNMREIDFLKISSPLKVTQMLLIPLHSEYSILRLRLQALTGMLLLLMINF